MNINKELNLSFIKNISEKQVYLVGDLLFLIGHIIYLFVFRFWGIVQLEKYNYFSVSFYLVMIFFIIKCKKRNPLMLIVLLEFLIHATICTFYLGWSMGFTQFLLVIIPIPFYQPLKKKFIPYILSLFDITVFVSLKIITTDRIPPYIFENDTKSNTIYLLNSIFSFIIIVYVSSIYIFSREYTQRKMVEQNEDLQKLATIDPLTSLFNRRAMENYMKIIRKSSQTTGKPYVVGLGDIDDFKLVNDTYGHSMGDEVLKTVSQIVVSNVPSEGYVCRWGGEEILFVIPSANLQDGHRSAENICKQIASKTFGVDEKKFNVTITFGVCEVDAGEDYEKAIRIADDRLYVGKENGKNTVII